MSVMGPLLIFIKYYWSWLFLGQKSATFLIAQTKKQKIYFWDKRVLLFWLHKQTNKKKEPQKTPKNNNKTPPPHPIVGREKWLNYYNIEYIKKKKQPFMIMFIYIYTPLDMGQTKYKIIQEIHIK